LRDTCPGGMPGCPKYVLKEGDELVRKEK